MKKLVILLFLLMPMSVFAQGTMRDYPVNNSPNTANDTLLGIDEQQDVANWAVNNFSFSGILSWIKANSGEYLEAAADFTTANEVIVATGTTKTTQRTPVQIDSSGNITNVLSMTQIPGPNPEWCFQDSSNPSTNKCTGYVGGDYRSGGVNNDSGDLIFSNKIGGVKTETGRFNSLNSQWEFPFNLLVPDEAYDADTWDGNNTVPTKNAVRDQIELIAGGGEVNDLVSVGTGQEIRVSKVGANINVKDIAAGSGISVSTDGSNNIVVGNTSPGGVTDGVNVGTGSGIRRDKTADNINLRSIVGLGRVSTAVAGNNNEIEISTTAEANDVASVGGGESLRSGKSGEDIQLKSLVAGANVVLTPNANEIEISTTAVSGESNTISTPTAGDADLVATPSKVGIDLKLKSLVAGANIGIVEDTQQVTISSTGGTGESNTISTTTPGDVELVATPSKVGVDLRLKSLMQGAGINLIETDDQVTVLSTVTSGETNTISTTTPGDADLTATPSKVGEDLRLKSLVAGTYIGISETIDQVTFNVPQASTSVIGAASFNSSDFNVAGGNVSLNYTNGQKATESQPGYLEAFANAGEVLAGTVDNKAIAPANLKYSEAARIDIGYNLVNPSTDVDTLGLVEVAYTVGFKADNTQLFQATCSVYTIGTGGSTGVQIVRRRAQTNINMLNTPLVITTAQFATSSDIDTGNDDLQQGDQILFEITGIHSTTAAQGLSCTLDLVEQ